MLGINPKVSDTLSDGDLEGLRKLFRRAVLDSDDQNAIVAMNLLDRKGILDRALKRMLKR